MPRICEQKTRALVATVRNERYARRTGSCGSYSEQLVWDPTTHGPYAVFDKQSTMVAVDVVGLMYDLGYQSVRMDYEAALLLEIEEEMRRLASENPMPPTPSSLQVLVALSRRIIRSAADSGRLRRA